MTVITTTGQPLQTQENIGGELHADKLIEIFELPAINIFMNLQMVHCKQHCNLILKVENVHFQTFPERGRPRKRLAKQELWQRNIRKSRRSRGLSYTSVKGKDVESRKLGPVCAEKCRLKCSMQFTHQRREAIFKSYWESGNYERQRDFICNHVHKVNAQYPLKINSRRQNTFSYFLVDSKDKRVKVCKMFFLHTLCIGEKTVSYALNKKSDGVLSKCNI